MNMDTAMEMYRVLAKVSVVSVLAVFTAFAGPSSVDAQEGAISGDVVSSETGEAVAGAVVTIVGTDIGALTDNSGQYRLESIPAGEHTLRVETYGFRPMTRRVTVRANTRITVDVVLTVTAVSLDRLVVTATGRTQRRMVGYATQSIDAAEVVETGAIRDVSDLLSARTPGVNVRVNSGTIGGGTPVRVRGSSSLATSNQPVVYVDGARVDAAPFNLTVSAGGQQTGALSINPEDVASIEVLSGASAATLYGTDAATGILRITTKDGTGSPGEANWRMWLSGGLHTEPNEYPANWAGIAADGSVCSLGGVTSGRCTQESLKSFNQLEDSETTPFSTGERLQLGGSVQGAIEGFDYYSSAEYERSQGVYGDNNELRLLNIRGNVGLEPHENVSLRFNNGFSHRNVTLPQNDNNLIGIFVNTLLAGADKGDFFLVSLDDISTIDTRQEGNRYTGSAAVDWTPFEWLRIRSTVGADVANYKDQQLFPVGGVRFGRLVLGERTSNSTLSESYTVESFFQTELPLTAAIESQTTVGGQFFVERRRTVFARGEELVPGSESISAAAITAAMEETTEARTVGFFVQERISWDDRLIATAGVRLDDNSSFGTDFGLAVYPAFNLSWVLSEESWFEPGDWLAELRLRGAFGQAGSRPGTTDAVSFFRSAAVTDATGANRTGVTFEGGNLGNIQLKPERTTEYEVGFDASLWNNRLTVAASYYNSTTEDVLIQQTLAPSIGATDQRLVNIGEVRNQGLEGQLDFAVEWGATRLDFGITASYNDNVLLELGEGVAPVAATEHVEHREGYPLGSWWDRPYTFNDENGDGLIEASEIAVGDTAVFLGNSIPPVELGVTPAITVFDRVRIRSHWSAWLGREHFGETESLRCLIGSSRFRHDPQTSLADQAKCLIAGNGVSEAGFITDADFLVLQELSVSLQAPDGWADMLGAEHLDLTVSGRNLGLWTGFDGLDPRINGQSVEFASGGELTQPPLRFWNATISVRF